MKARDNAITVSSFDHLFTEARTRIEALLPDFLVAQRWFRSKARSIAGVTIVDAIHLKMDLAYAVMIQVKYDRGEPETYFLPVMLKVPGEEADAIARVHEHSDTERLVSNALADADFRMWLLDSIACDAVLCGDAGELTFTRTNAFDRQCDQWVPELPSKVSRAEQSNSSIIFGDRYILKLFRKLEYGINPDIEIGKFLTEHQFAHTPAVLGEIEYRSQQGGSAYAGILQSFVSNQGDAWDYTLSQVRQFFERVQGAAPQLPSQHAFDLRGQQLPGSDLIGEYLESARLLGRRTAEMHKVLGSGTEPDFAPEAFTRQYGEVLYGEMIAELDRAVDLIQSKPPGLPEAQELVAKASAIRERFGSLRDAHLSAERIRHHGDYHLGQVLWTGSDFVIIDFEGEPARSLEARRLKTFAMRDVAGMVRSFSYAGYAALDGKTGLDDWAAFWAACVSAAFLEAYLDATGNSQFAGTPDEQRLLYDAFVLQKALYEVSYELNNRPQWVRIPLRGILSLLNA